MLDLIVEAFHDLNRRLGEPPEPPGPIAAGRVRMRRLLATDPGGAWVAERDGEVVGCALGDRARGRLGPVAARGRPDAQSSGVGRELLARACEYGGGARGWIVLASRDPRALRSYARLGLHLHPALAARGRPRRVAAPPEVRRGSLDDLPLTEEVDRAVRGAAHGEDILALLESGGDLLVLPERGYAVVRDGAIRLLAARDEDGAVDAAARLPGRRRRPRGVRRVDHQRPGVGGRAVPRGGPGAPDGPRRGVPGRRRRAVRAVPAQRGLPLSNVLPMAKEPRSLTGKVVAITGGGRGIGRAIAQALAREGARVAVCDLDRELAEQTAAELGEPALGLALDVTDHAGFMAFLDEVEQRLGPLDVLVNNAGIMPVTPLVEESADSIARQLDINLRAVIHGTQEAMRRMVPRRTGHIVNLSSIAGRSGFPHLATYCATKHGVVGLSEAVARRAARHRASRSPSSCRASCGPS